MIQFFREPFGPAFKEVGMLGLDQQHFSDAHEHNERLEVNMDWNYLLKLEEAGFATGVAARNDGQLIGYSLVIFSPSFETKGEYIAHIYEVFISPEYRGLGLVKDLINYTEQVIRATGIKQVLVPVKPKYDFSRYLEETGYFLSKRLYAKYLD